MINPNLWKPENVRRFIKQTKNGSFTIDVSALMKEFGVSETPENVQVCTKLMERVLSSVIDHCTSYTVKTHD